MEKTDNLLQLSNGRYFIDERQSRVYSIIIEAHPHYSSVYKWTELSMAELFVECYKDVSKYCKEIGVWYTYNGSMWEKDIGSLLVMDKLQEFVKLLDIYSNELDSKEVDIVKYKSFIVKLLDRRARERMIKDAQNLVSISLSDFDKNPYLINCENGTYDLENDSFRFHSSEDYITLKTNCLYILPTSEINYNHTRWNQFIDEITNNDKEKADYLQRALGYSLLGKTTEECMFMAWGKTTRNGKGTLFNSIHNLLGTYSAAASSQLLCKTNAIKDPSRANPALCALKGKRFIIMSEIAKYAEIDEDVFKKFTGNDLITARELYKSEFEFSMQGTFWIMCNDLPKIIDKGIFSSDRIKVIEFDRHFDAETRDITLKSQFQEKTAKAVIFKWLIDGYKKYKKVGLAEPKEITENIEKYELDNDIVKRFINDCCENNQNNKILKTDMRAFFESWRKKLDLPGLDKQTFYKDFEKYYDICISHGYAYFKGVSYKEENNGTK